MIFSAPTMRSAGTKHLKIKHRVLKVASRCTQLEQMKTSLLDGSRKDLSLSSPTTSATGATALVVSLTGMETQPGASGQQGSSSMESRSLPLTSASPEILLRSARSNLKRQILRLER